MVDEKMYSVNEICAELNISIFTLSHWYDLQQAQIKEGLIDKPYLPEPLRLSDQRGKPRRWTESMVEELRKYQSNIVVGRNGIYGAYSNPNHKNTRKYQKTFDK